MGLKTLRVVLTFDRAILRFLNNFFTSLDGMEDDGREELADMMTGVDEDGFVAQQGDQD